MKKVLVLTIAVLFGFTVFTGCASLTGRTAGEIVDDSTITATINTKIITDPDLHFLKVNVDTTEGNVVLTGFVSSKASEDRLMEISKGVRGVKSVKSLLKIEEKR